MKTKAASKIAKKTSAAKKAGASKKSAAKPQAAKKAAKATKSVADPVIEAPAEATEKLAKTKGNGALIMSMINGANGATLPELMEATGWQRHSIRGFISTASKKRGIESAKDEAGQRRYRLID